nr:MAG TPA: major tail protein [Caudoviricetes sp.]
MRFTLIPEKTFEQLQLNAGVLLSSFTPAGMEQSAILEALIAATSGGVNFTATPTYTDFGEDIDNAPVNVKELKKLESWEIKMSGTFVTATPEMVKRMIGAADVDGTDATKVVPRNDVLDTDFKDLWWVGDYSDKNSDTTGGFVAIHMLNTLSTGGFQLQSGNREKGQFSFEFTAHYSIQDQTKVPFEVYVSAGTGAA